MSDRHMSPAPGQPNPAKIPVHLRDAQPTAEDERCDGAATVVEARRVRAVRALHALRLRWQAEAIEAEIVALVGRSH